ncbi:MAG: hypothetical protein JSU72_02230 [Deltaproteobacteria bacterium]|nr:MAG: hypothetical protein JSU72_02230 [Deltaproteobacteria bacterium]
MVFSSQTIHQLLSQSSEQRQALRQVYGRLPTTRCRRRTLCCSLLPEMTLVEALSVIQLLANMTTPNQIKLSRGLVHYFFLNAVEIAFCPFLDGDACLIYADRFFGCRAYGLWSRRYYEEQVARSREAKRLNQQQWEGLGVSLPQAVVDFQLPYCSQVEIEGDVRIDDQELLNVLDTVETISGQFEAWHLSFRQRYFSDLSFLLASLTFGMAEAVRLKFETVRDILSTGKRDRLAEAVEGLPNLWMGLR